MFFLKKENRDYVDCDEFGWWLTGSKPEPQIYDDVLKSDGISRSGSTQSIPSSVDPDHQNSFLILQDSSADINREKKDDDLHPETEDDDPEEICIAEEPPCKTSSRSYTPERLVRTEDYAILTSSPTFSSTSKTQSSTHLNTHCKQYSNKRHRYLNHLIDQKLIGATHLEALLDPDAVDIKLPVALAKRKVLKGRFSPDKSSTSGDLLAIANSDSPRRSLTPDLMSSGSSCERLNSDWNRYDNRAIDDRDDSLRIGQFTDLKNFFKTGSNSSELDFLRDKKCRGNSLRRESLPELEKDPEIVVQQLSGRIDHIKDMNKNIFGDLSSLRKNFKWAEQKTGNLTTETTRLRREIRDLRYLDDLLNLLRGELERISQRNWPFNLGHTDHHNEEVNLVV